MLPWIAAAPLLGACGSAPAGAETTASTASAIYGGLEDTGAAANDAVVAVKVGDGQMFELCTGTLVAPSLVLTARHCVSVQDASSVSCSENGTSLDDGPDLGADQPLGSIHVYTGPTPSLLGAPDANATALVHPQGATLCNEDVAFIVLDRKLTVAPPLTLRFTGAVSTTETVRAVGYGQNDQSLPIGTRFRKDEVGVLAVGATVSASGTPLGSHEFEVGESICNGDSGGPAIDEVTGEVVGVVSRGPQDCTATSGHVYTSPVAFQSLYEQALAAAAAPPASGDGGAGSAADGGTASTSSTSAGESPGTGASSGSGTTGASGRGVDLEAGKGNTCSAARAPAGGTSGAPYALAPIGLAGLASLLRRRRLR